jgi:hypothetical protein
MNSKTLYLSFLVVILMAYACTKSESQEIETQTQLESEPASGIDPELSPLKVGSEFSRFLSDTLNIQMYETTLNPGDSIGLHEHYDHAIYALQGGKLLVYIDGEDPVEMEIPTHYGMVSGPLKDAAVNISDSPITLLTVEINRPRE